MNRIKKLTAVFLLTALLSSLLAQPAFAALALDYSQTKVIEEVESSETFTDEYFKVTTPADEDNVIYVEGKAAIDTKMFAIRLQYGADGEGSSQQNSLCVFVQPDGNNAFAVRINTAPGNKDIPTATVGTVMPAQGNWSTMPGWKEVPVMEEGLHRLVITSAYTDEDAYIGGSAYGGTLDDGTTYKGWANGSLSGSQGRTTWKGAVLQVTGSNNNPKLVDFPNALNARIALQSTLEPNQDTIDAYPGSYVRYMDPYLTDLMGILKNPNGDKNQASTPLTDTQVAYLAKVSNSVTAGCTTDYQKLLKIYEYVASNFYYDYYDRATEGHIHCNPYYNLYALRNGGKMPGGDYVSNGDGTGKVATVCDGYAAMVIALARAQGIPARIIKGFAIEGQNPHATWGNTTVEGTNHLWAEAYLDGRWMVIDAKRGTYNRWDRTSASDPGTWTKQGYISYAAFDMSDECFNASYIVTEMRGGDVDGQYLANKAEYEQLTAFLEANGNGQKLNSRYTANDPATWGQLDDADTGKFLKEGTDGYGRTFQISWPGKELAGELDLSNFTSLKYLTINTNALTGLKVDGCTALTSLYAGYNDLTSFDSTSCTSLKTIALKGNELTSAAILHDGGKVTLKGEEGSFGFAYDQDASKPLTIYVNTDTEPGITYDGIYKGSTKVSSAAEYSLDPAAGSTYTVRFTNNRDDSIIVSQDGDKDGGESMQVIFSVIPWDPSVVTYQWQYRKPGQVNFYDSGYASANTAHLQIRAELDLDGYEYRCIVTRSDGKIAVSDPVTLTVNEVNATFVASHPKDVTAEVGDTYVSFRMNAFGKDLAFQWQWKSPNGSWTDSAYTGYEMKVAEVKSYHNGYQYRCKITDASGAVTYTNAATLTLKAQLAIASSPENTTVTAGEKAKFSVSATGEGLTYQWYYKSPTGTSFKQTTFTGAKTDTLTVTTKETHDGYQYKCKVTDANGNSVWSKAATLTVQSPSQPAVTITTQPESVNVKYGYVYFTVGTSRDDVTYQWQYKSPAGTSFKTTTLSGNKTDTLKVYGNASRDGYQYRCKVTDGDGNVVYSEPALLGVLTIAAQPADTTVNAGEKASFTVEATGQGLSYQWYYKSPTGTKFAKTTFSGTKTDTLTVTTKATHDGYQYKCKITDASGNYRWSEAAALTVQSSSQPAVTITTQPESVNVKYGYVYFTVGASREDVTYQWQYLSTSGKWYSTSLSGNKTDTLKVYGKAERDGAQYRCKVTDGDGNVVYTDAVTLGVLTIAAQPEDVVVKAGEKATFSVSATGQGLTYQWYYKSPTGTKFARTTWSGAKTDTMTVTTKADDIRYNGYQYKCKITDASGNYRWSEAAELGVGLFRG